MKALGVEHTNRTDERAQLCPTLCNPMDFTVHGILQAGIPDWEASPFSRGSS